MIKRNLIELIRDGYWFCLTCDSIIEPVDGEQGRSNHCPKCQSTYIFWNPPLDHEPISNPQGKDDSTNPRRVAGNARRFKA
jgi:hypothetical protein